MRDFVPLLAGAVLALSMRWWWPRGKYSVIACILFPSGLVYAYERDWTMMTVVFMLGLIGVLADAATGAFRRPPKP